MNSQEITLNFGRSPKGHFGLYMFTIFTIYEVVNVNRLKAYNEDLQTFAAQHQMTREIIRELHPDLFVTITSFDDMVQSKGYSYAHEHFENSKPKEKPGK